MPTDTNNANGNATDVNEVPRDEFGRDAAERLVELSPRVAEAVNQEVTAGKHATYDDALEHIVARGLAEIARARKAADALKAARLVTAKQKLYTDLLAQHPELITKGDFVAKMIAELGVKTQR